MDSDRKHLIVLTFGNDAPSTSFRWFKFRENFANQNVEVLFTPAKGFCDFDSLERYDVVVLQKTMLPRQQVKQIRKKARRFLYDVDDRIWLRPGIPYRGWSRWKIERRMKTICDQVDGCLSANSWIASDLVKFGGKSSVVPMSIDSSVWHYQVPDSEPVVIGWTGGPKNLVFLEKILPAIDQILRAYPGARFVVHSGKDPEWSSIEYTYEPFIAGREPEVLS
ncbi:MAG: hypothetical protein AAF558_14675, partial [Verrucomicrobiota bacterium]